MTILWMWHALLVSLSLFILIILRSMVFTVTGRARWKGRNLVRPALRWL